MICPLSCTNRGHTTPLLDPTSLAVGKNTVPGVPSSLELTLELVNVARDLRVGPRVRICQSTISPHYKLPRGNSRNNAARSLKGAVQTLLDLVPSSSGSRLASEQGGSDLGNTSGSLVQTVAHSGDLRSTRGIPA